MDNMFNYWKNKHGILCAIEDHYSEEIKTDEIAYAAYQQAIISLYALEKRMEELSEQFERAQYLK